MIILGQIFSLKKNSSTCTQFDLNTKDLYKNSLLSVSYKKKKSMLAGFREVCRLKDRSRQKGVFLLRASAQLEPWQCCGLKA